MEDQAQNSDSSLAAKSDIKVEVLQFADARIHVVKEEIREMLRSDVETHKRDIKSQNWRAIKIGLAVLSLLVGANLLTLWRGYQWAQNRVQDALDEEVKSIRKTVSERLDQEFETERIRALIGERAKEYTERRAQGYITESVEKSIRPLSLKMQSELLRAQKKIENDLKSFDANLKNTRENIVKEYRILSTEVINSRIIVFTSCCIFGCFTIKIGIDSVG